VTDRDLLYAPLHGFLVFLAQGWKLALMPSGDPAFLDIHHGKYSVLIYREV